MPLVDLFWRLVARILARPHVADRLIARAMRTPYTHILSRDGSDLYMGRWWLFNPYPALSDGGGANRGWRGWLPSIRIHWIRRADQDRDLHDHPWNARTIILRGGYLEERQGSLAYISRQPGSTALLRFGEYHRIRYVPPEGAWTLFITWRKRGTWGFWVDGRKVPWREYLGIKP